MLKGLVNAPPKLRPVWGHGFRFLLPSTLGQFGHVGTKGNRSLVEKDGAECLTRGPVYLALGFGGLFWAVREATIYGAPSAAHLILFRFAPNLWHNPEPLSGSTLRHLCRVCYRMNPSSAEQWLWEQALRFNNRLPDRPIEVTWLSEPRSLSRASPKRGARPDSPVSRSGMMLRKRAKGSRLLRRWASTPASSRNARAG